MFITDCYSQKMKHTTPFGAALCYFRKKERRLTQPRFAEKMNVSQAMISDLETGKKDGSAELRENITKYFKVPYDDFLETGRQKLQAFSTDIDYEKLAKEVTKLKIPDGDNDIEKYKTEKNKDHHAKINEFKDQEKALTMNSLAVYLEALEPKEMSKAINYFKERIDYQEAIKGVKKKTDTQKDQKKTSNGN